MNDIDDIAYDLYCKNSKSIIIKFNGNIITYNKSEFISLKNFFIGYYEDAKNILRKQKLNKICNDI